MNYSQSATISNKLGLHARATAKLCDLARSFESKIIISKAEQAVDAKSIMGVMMLAASCGSEVAISATGSDSKAAVSAIIELIGDKFGEAQ